jgi:hypothetical protein
MLQQKGIIMKSVVLAFLLLVIVCALFSQDTDSLSGTVSIPPYLLAANNTTTAIDSIHTKLPYAESYKLGSKYAKDNPRAAGYILGGLAAGLTLNLLGMAIVTTAASESRLPVLPDSCDEQGFIDGYKRQSAKINRSAAIIGGATGSIIQTALAVYLVYLFVKFIDAIGGESVAYIKP